MFRILSSNMVYTLLLWVPKRQGFFLFIPLRIAIDVLRSPIDLSDRNEVGYDLLKIILLIVNNLQKFSLIFREWFDQDIMLQQMYLYFYILCSSISYISVHVA